MLKGVKYYREKNKARHGRWEPGGEERWSLILNKQSRMISLKRYMGTSLKEVRQQTKPC